MDSNMLVKCYSCKIYRTQKHSSFKVDEKTI
nr:MAG TPA: hypothetical protein [Caudoviricetes sp.]